MRMASSKFGVWTLAAAYTLLPAVASAQVVSCPLNGGGDQVTRGFYVPNFTGAGLGTVTLTYYPNSTGSHTVQLTARAGTYDGAIIGSVTQTFNLTTSATIVYDFGGAPVTPGSTVTFTQTLLADPGVGVLFYDTGTGPCASCASTSRLGIS